MCQDCGYTNSDCPEFNDYGHRDPDDPTVEGCDPPMSDEEEQVAKLLLHTLVEDKVLSICYFGNHNSNLTANDRPRMAVVLDTCHGIARDYASDRPEDPATSAPLAVEHILTMAHGIFDAIHDARDYIPPVHIGAILMSILHAFAEKYHPDHPNNIVGEA